MEITTIWKGYGIGSGDYLIDLYWQQHFHKKSITKEEKYLDVVKVIKDALLLIHGSADVERSFSSSNHMLTEDRKIYYNLLLLIDIN